MSQAPRFDFARLLAGAGEPTERLVRTLRGAASWCERTPLQPLLDELLASRPQARAALRAQVTVDHLGFLLPGWCRPLLSSAANAAGFPLAHRAFPSALIARELGRLVGQRRLATTIFKAYGRLPDGTSCAFEAFVPDGDDARTERWIDEGACNHIAIECTSAAAWQAARTAFAADRVPVSAFLYDQAVFLPGENATMLYYDVEVRTHPFRLEVRGQGDLTEMEGSTNA